MTLTAYSLGSPFGKDPCEAIQRDHNKEPFAKLEKDPIAVWGQLRGAKELLAKSRHFYRLDHAYVGRLEYYRMTRDDFQPARITPRPADRWEQLKKSKSLKIGEWRKGKHILVTLSDQRTYDFFGLGKWWDHISRELKTHTDRPIVGRSRTESRPLAEQLKDCHCLVTYASNTAIDALLAGVPVFVFGPSIARPMAWCSDLSHIETPYYPDNREEFFRHMAYCQFTLQEFKSGFARAEADATAANPVIPGAA